MATSDLRRLSGSPSKLSNQVSSTQASPKLEFQKPSLDNISIISWENPSSKKSSIRGEFLVSVASGPVASGLPPGRGSRSSPPSGWEVRLGLGGSSRKRSWQLSNAVSQNMSPCSSPRCSQSSKVKSMPTSLRVTNSSVMANWALVASFKLLLLPLRVPGWQGCGKHKGAVRKSPFRPWLTRCPCCRAAKMSRRRKTSPNVSLPRDCNRPRQQTQPQPRGSGRLNSSHTRLSAATSCAREASLSGCTQDPPRQRQDSISQRAVRATSFAFPSPPASSALLSTLGVW